MSLLRVLNRGYRIAAGGNALLESYPFGILSTFLAPSASVPLEEFPIC